jgi:hypothetical protein
VVTDPATPTFGGSSVEGAHKALAALHRSPELLDETGVSATMPHALVVVPEQAVVDEDIAHTLVAYVAQGGLLLTSGATIASPILQAALGVTAVRRGVVQDGHVLLTTHDEPTGIDAPWDEVTGGEALYPLYLSWDQFNPECRNLPNNWPMHGQVDEQQPEAAGFPAAITRRVGQGRIVHICSDLFAHYKTLGDPQVLRWLREILTELDPIPAVRTDLPSWVDLSLRRTDDRLLIHLVNQNPGRDVAKLGTEDTWVDEIPTVGPYRLAVRLPQPPMAVTWEPAGVSLATIYEDGVLSLEIPRFRIHGCVVVEG